MRKNQKRNIELHCKHQKINPICGIEKHLAGKQIYLVPYCHADHAWLHSRDWHLRRYLAVFDKMVELLEVDQSVGICGCKIIDSNGGENILSWNNPWFFIKWIKAIHDLIYKDEVSKILSNRDNIWYPNIISGAILAIKTDDFKRLPGFAKIYLGKKGEWMAISSSVLSLLGIILAYLILGGEFLAGLLSPFFGGSKIIYTLLYFSQYLL